MLNTRALSNHDLPVELRAGCKQDVLFVATTSNSHGIIALWAEEEYFNRLLGSSLNHDMHT